MMLAGALRAKGEGRLERFCPQGSPSCIAERSLSMNEQRSAGEPLSLWWKRSVILTLIVCFTVLIWLAAKGYRDAPPIPEKIVTQAGQLIITGKDIIAGQQVFLKYGLMENGTIWGHGALRYELSERRGTGGNA